MENHFEICMTEDQLRGISSIGLAHMGDAVFELLVRGWLCQHGKATGKGLHQATIQLVRAEHQAACAEKILVVIGIGTPQCPFRSLAMGRRVVLVEHLSVEFGAPCLACIAGVWAVFGRSPRKIIDTFCS